jgi:hypothetical protein
MVKVTKVAIAASAIVPSSVSARAEVPDPASAGKASAGGGYIRRANNDADYAQLGIDRTSIASWEDGQR